MAETVQAADLLRLSAQIVAAHAVRNAVSAEALPALIRDVHAALAGVGQVMPAAPERPHPAVSIRRSVQPDHLVCLEDGAKLTMLKRYLATRFGLTPDQYRARWELPHDYPMVAPDYARRRSALAKEFGLGRIRSAAPEATAISAAKPKVKAAKVAEDKSTPKAEAGTESLPPPAKKRGRPPSAKPAVVDAPGLTTSEQADGE